jgi:transglutaminase-like putative cysteine protease
MTTRPALRAWIDAGVPLALLAIALLGFAPTFGDGSYLRAGLGGIVVGAGIAAAAVLLRLSLPVSLVVGVAVYFLFGSALATPGSATLLVLPNLETLRALAIGPVFGWADLVTIGAPVQAPPHVHVVPYFCGWFVALVDVTLALRWLAPRPPRVLSAAVLVLGPLAVLVAGILTGTDDPYLALLRGLAFAAIAVVWLGLRLRPAAQEGVAPSRALLLRRLSGTAVLLAVALAAGGIGGVVAAPLDASRYVVRDHVEPPFDVERFTSPLAGFRQYTQAEDDVILTATGLPEDARIRLAALDGYDGILWRSTNARQAADASGSFAVVGERIALPAGEFGEPVEVTIELGDYHDVWLPVAGYLTGIRFDGADPAAELRDLRYNRASGTAVEPGGLAPGERYTISVVQPPEYSDAELRDAEPALVELPPVTPIQILSSTAAAQTKDAESPYEKLRALESWMRDDGYLAHGEPGDPVASPAGHGADRMVRMLSGSFLLGDAEQYASAFAIMARSLNLPARVVMGFQAPEGSSGTVEFTGADVTAWVEVAFEGHGWVVFDPTPDDADVPLEEVPEPQSKPRPQVRQPPRAIENPDDLVAPLEVDSDEDDDPEVLGIPGWVFAVAAGVGIPALAIGVPFLVIGAAKARRRRRRRVTGTLNDRVTGAWEEYLDGYAELGYPVPKRLSRTQLASALGVRTESEAVLGALAGRADRAAFSGRTLSDDEVEAQWAEFVAAHERLESGAGRWRRVLGRFAFRRGPRRG